MTNNSVSVPKNKQKTLVEFSRDNSEKTLPLGSIKLNSDSISSQIRLEKTFGYSETKPSSELIDQLIKDKYKILGLLGEGGGSKVYLCERVLVSDQVALKMLFPELAREQIKVKRFHLEATTTASIKHPNVIAVYDFDYTEKGIPFIVTELLRGQTLLGEIKQQGRLSLNRAIQILMPICAALSVAHTRGIVHRDLKPGNIVLHRMDDNSEVVKVIDFGIAKSLLNENRVNTAPGMVFGTPSYMSPEHCLGDEFIDGRSDVYSLGVLLFEMLTNKLPFQSDSPTKLMFKHVREHPPSPRSFCSDISLDVETIILKSMSKEPSRRFATTLDFAEALKQASNLS